MKGNDDGGERERARERENESNEGERGFLSVSENVEAMSSRGLRKASRRVASKWSRSLLRSRWRRRKANCKLQLWRGKEGFSRGLGWDR